MRSCSPTSAGQSSQSIERQNGVHVSCSAQAARLAFSFRHRQSLQRCEAQATSIVGTLSTVEDIALNARQQEAYGWVKVPAP
eukprot:1141619-Pelagomonas_calceolata.AAC.3